MSLLFGGFSRLARLVRGGDGVQSEKVEAELRENGGAVAGVGAGCKGRRLSIEEFKPILDSAEEGSTSMRALLDSMSALDEELPTMVAARLFRHLSRENNITQLLKFLRSAEEDDSMEDARARTKFSYVAANALAHGPPHLVHSLASLDTALDELLEYFRTEDPLDARTTINVCNVIFSLLDMKPMELLRRMAASGDIVYHLVAHINHASVAELLVHLLEGRDSGYNFLQPNLDHAFLTALPVLSNEGVFDLLASKYCRAAGGGDTDFEKSEVLDNAAFVFRWLVVKLCREGPRYPQNVSMRHLDIFRNPGALDLIFTSGIDAGQFDMHARALCNSVMLVEQVIKAHSDAEGMWSSILENEHYGSENAALGGAELGKVESVVISKTDKLVGILEEALDGEDQGPPPLGLARLSIVKLFATCFQAGSMNLSKALMKKGVHVVLFELLARYKNNSLLHRQIVLAMEALLYRADSYVKKSLFFDFSIVRRILDVWNDNTKVQKTPEAPSCLAALIQMSFAVWDCLVLTKASSPSEDLQALISPNTFRKFVKFSQDVLSKTQMVESHTENSLFSPNGRGDEDSPPSDTSMFGTPHPEPLLPPDALGALEQRPRRDTL